MQSYHWVADPHTLYRRYNIVPQNKQTTHSLTPTNQQTNMAISFTPIYADPAPIHWIRNRCIRRKKKENNKNKNKEGKKEKKIKDEKQNNNDTPSTSAAPVTAAKSWISKRDLIRSGIQQQDDSYDNISTTSSCTTTTTTPLSMLYGLEDSILPIIFSYVGPELSKPCTCCSQIEGNYLVFCCENFIPYAVSPVYDDLPEDDINSHIERLVRYIYSQDETPLPKEAFFDEEGCTTSNENNSNNLQYFSYCMKMAQYSKSETIYDEESEQRLRRPYIQKLPGSYKECEGMGAFGWSCYNDNKRNKKVINKIWTPFDWSDTWTSYMKPITSMTLEELFQKGFSIYVIDGVAEDITIDDFSASNQNPWKQHQQEGYHDRRDDGGVRNGGPCLLVLTREIFVKEEDSSRYRDEIGPILGTLHEQETYVFDFGSRQDVVDRIVSEFRSYLLPQQFYISKK